MLTGIDHLVIAVPQLEAAIKSYEGLGFTVVPGGRHPVGTHNALIAFADGAYVELIAFYEPSPDHRWWAPLQQGGGFVDFCLQTDDLAADTARLRHAGVDLGDPTPSTRTRPDGYRVRWVLSVPRGAYRGIAPFLIRDETPRQERVPRATGHSNAVTGIDTVTVAVSDVATVRRWYAEALGSPGHEIRRDDLDASGVRFTIGPHRFDFVAPGGPRSPLGPWLRARGPSPYAAVLTAASGPARALDEGQTLGARLSLA